MSARVLKYLSERQSINSPFNQDWIQLEQLYHSRLWHELTLHVKSLINQQKFQDDTELKEFYDNFLSDFEHRINPLSFVEITIPIVEKYSNVNEKIHFIEYIREKVKNDSLSNLLCHVMIGKIYLENDNFIETKKIIEELEPKIYELGHVTDVHAKFYDLSSKYHLKMANHSEYYENALKYLGCFDNSSLSKYESAQRAFYLGLAALLADSIYNFGEILQHPILNSLKNTREEWLIHLLEAFNNGDVDRYQQLQPCWHNQIDLRMGEAILDKKVKILCLMNMIFVAGGSRSLAFGNVALKAKIPIDQVEFLAMNALSLGLIRGSIDQVEEQLNMHWVKPRILDLKHVSILKDRLDRWTNDVKQLSTLVEKQSGDLLS